MAGLLGAAPRGASVSFDPNIRPALLPPRDAVVATFEGLIRHCDLVKLSDEDARWLHPADDDDRMLDRLLEAGVTLAVITRGASGLTLASRRARIEVPAVAVTVADTIGAGDAAMGALIDGYLDHGRHLDGLDEAELTRIGRWAADVAGITASRAGAEPPRRAELTDREVRTLVREG